MKRTSFGKWIALVVLAGGILGGCAAAIQTPKETASELTQTTSVSPASTSDTATVYVTKKGKIYHLSDCRRLAKDNIPMQLRDAAIRFTPCKACRPPALDAQRLANEVARQQKLEQEWEAAQLQGNDLELVSWRWGTTGGGSYVEASGQVKNLTSHPLENVVAVVTFYDKNGEFIATDDALIDYRPIMPGQTSPFTVMRTRNPLMEKATVEFKEYGGGTYSTYKRKKK